MSNSTTNKSNPFFEPLSPLSIGLKMSLLTVVALVVKATPTQPTWAILMVLFAALFLVPIAFEQLRRNQTSFPMHKSDLVSQFLCALSLTFSFLMERSTIAGIFAIPYAVWCMEIFFYGLKINTKLTYLATLTTFGFLLNASLWLVMDRFDIQPLSFTTWIVILTGVHFHYAGFALMACLTLFLCREPHDRFIQTTVVLLILGIILTATGITTTQIGFDQSIETVAGVWMAIAGMLAGSIFIKKSFPEPQPTQGLWFIGGVSLVLGMCLACLYALRSIIILDELTLPFMQAVHGTLNALGFGTLMLLGWAFRKAPPQ